MKKIEFSNNDPLLWWITTDPYAVVATLEVSDEEAAAMTDLQGRFLAMQGSIFSRVDVQW